MTDRPLGAQISHMLKSRGVEVIFGIPGVHNQEMYRGIEEAGLTHVLARHEQGAGFMADGYARATGKPGVAYVITGPGLCNIMTPMGQAYSDSVPMLVISSCLNRADLGMGRGRLHEMKDQEIAAGTVCDWSLTAMDAASAYQLIDRALSEFATGRKRPKHIQVPIEVLEALALAAPEPMSLATTGYVPYDVTDIVFDAVEKAQRPLFVFGGGAREGATVWRDVVKAAGAASFVTYAGMGIIAEGGLHFGSSLARPGSVDVIASADLVVAVGTELSETDLWRDDLGHTGTFIRIDIDADELNDTPATHRIHADAGQVAKELWAKRGDWSDKSGWTEAEVAKTREKWRAEVTSERPGIPQVADALRAALPDDTVIYSDMTQFAYAALEIWPMNRPNQWHHPCGFGTLGYALPSAIGGALARKGKPTIAIAGDYGFQYTLQELMVAVELELCLPIILWDNGKLGEIEDSMVAAQIAPNAVIQRNPDFVKFAEAFGAASAAPKSLDELQDVVREALKTKGPTLIYVRSEIAA
ncbi:acetolactate synthase-1/2/3 large subunit/5-guanidino-2-oxopentanoate decarboxylase [Loktanella ponticola]|uniref:Acetolactate synthase-1/2/3 large subunit/5-guanidino-2-oxopentanoate decarboxylase n=1 Tax=Yoonia ponticola TaxID=1524255 RepID=A0A7W9EYY3_9RHOB|nr:5-guanidino-2-oxopentanoate decarboxylase [Yoonia ponticola]MBB5723308.1 acetolactate synthase-1/2/3 large subunit/5-guanidino-2-oxopentanoate decarboxylase [Yoonia ponticola]